MIQRQQANLIEVGDLAQFLGDTDLVFPAPRLQRFAGNGDVLVVIHREVLSVAGAGAQRRDTQDVGDELEAFSVPGEDHGAGAGEARCLFDGGQAVHGHLSFVLDQPVGPGDADRVDLRTTTQTHHHRNALVGHLVVVGSRLDFDLRADRELRVLHAGKGKFHPIAVGGSDVAAQVKGAVLHAGTVALALAIEIHRADEGIPVTFECGVRLKLTFAIDQQQGLRIRQGHRKVGASVMIRIAGPEVSSTRR